jgi:glycosyltransferase involved in cell wall biosynthesis
VVAFNTGTACEMVEDKKTGLLVQKGDVPGLADAIQYLLSDVSVARQMGRNAQKAVAEKFNIRTIARQTLAYYRSILTDRETTVAR